MQGADLRFNIRLSYVYHKIGLNRSQLWRYRKIFCKSGPRIAKKHQTAKSGTRKKQQNSTGVSVVMPRGIVFCQSMQLLLLLQMSLVMLVMMVV